jgi:hypothetical protein
VWRWCCEVFDYLALGAIVDGAVFCVHGGLSPNLQGIDQVSFFGILLPSGSHAIPNFRLGWLSRLIPSVHLCCLSFLMGLAEVRLDDPVFKLA